MDAPRLWLCWAVDLFLGGSLQLAGTSFRNDAEEWKAEQIKPCPLCRDDTFLNRAWLHGATICVLLYMIVRSIDRMEGRYLVLFP